MSESADVSDFARYLLAKRTVDDRALNRHVYETLVSSLPAVDAPLRVLDIGCGVGTMAGRMQRWGLFADRRIEYLGIDSEPSTIASAAAPEHADWTGRFEAADLYEFARRAPDQSAFDLIIAHAVLDLLDLSRALPLLHGLMRPGGLGWFTINFDGMSLFEPPLDAALDAAIESAYHATMDARLIDGAPAGESRTGRRLFAALPRAGLPILAAGASDWVVHPVSGVYPGDEGYFLEAILGFVESSLNAHPALAPDALSSWLVQRRAQIANGELVYVAHQLDFLVGRPLQ